VDLRLLDGLLGLKSDPVLFLFDSSRSVSLSGSGVIVKLLEVGTLLLLFTSRRRVSGLEELRLSFDVIS
jgi:hypothetical protein